MSIVATGVAATMIEIIVLMIVAEVFSLSIAVAVALLRGGIVSRVAISSAQVHHHGVRVRCRRDEDGRRHETRRETAFRRRRGLQITLPFELWEHM